MAHSMTKMGLAAATAITLLTSATVTARAQNAPPAPAVTVATPLGRVVDKWDEYTGRFEAVQQVEVRARVSGFIDSIHFTDGQMVKAGDLLFKIDPRPYGIAVDSAQADVVRAKAQVAQGANDVARAEQLSENRTITQRDVDQRRATYDVARAQQLSAEAALRNAQLNLDWTSVRAPISGRVSNRKIDVGNLIEGGQGNAAILTKIVTLDPIHFIFDASEADYLRYNRLAADRQRPSSRDAATVAFVRLADETEWTRSGHMNFVDNELGSRSGTIRGRAIFDNKDLFLTPGEFGRIRLFGGKLNALLVPDEAILSDQARKIVLVVGPENKVVAKPVKLGPMSLGLRVVLDGLTAEDRVVIDGLANPFVRPGSMVAPQDGQIKTAAME